MTNLKRKFSVAALLLLSFVIPYCIHRASGLWVTVSSVTLILISITMLTRANDLGRKSGVVWNTRRIGLVLAGFAPWSMVWYDIQTDGSTLTGYDVCFRLGLMLVFFTTPHLPPWWRWISGLVREEDINDDTRAD